MIMNYTIDYVHVRTGESDSNIVEYVEDVLYLVNLLIDNK